MTDARPSRRARQRVLAICCMSIFVVSLDNTIVNVALPPIRGDLGASVSQLQWIVDAYTVVLASLLVLAGSVADRVGRARIFQSGLVLFTLGSLLCSVAPTASSLIGFRMVQGVGGSMLNPVAMSIIRNTFTDERERAQAIGLWGAVVGLSMALGPLLGGGLIAAASWRAIFWVNAPVGLLAVALVHRFVPESRAPTPRRVDPLGQLLVIVALGSLTYAIIESGSAGLASARALVPGATALVALVLFVGYERRRADPLIDPRFFRSIPFSGAALIAIAGFTALGGFLFITNLYLQDDRGLSAAHAGLYTLPMAATAFVAAPLSGRLVGRRGARPSLVAGGAGLAVGSLMLTGLEPTTPVATLLVAYLVFGLGFGMVNPPITNTAVSGMPAAQAGVAAAIASTSRLVGISLGVAIIGAVVAAGRGTPATSFAEASRPGWWIAAACGVAVVALGLASTTPRALATARAVGGDAEDDGEALTRRLAHLYDAFNARDIDRVLESLAADVDWPNAWEGGRVRGHGAVREYWTRQWQAISPRVDPLRFERRGDGAVAVEVQQRVGLPGGEVRDARVVHVYRLRDGLIVRMDVE